MWQEDERENKRNQQEIQQATLENDAYGKGYATYP